MIQQKLLTRKSHKMDTSLRWTIPLFSAKRRLFPNNMTTISSVNMGILKFFTPPPPQPSSSIHSPSHFHPPPQPTLLISTCIKSNFGQLCKYQSMQASEKIGNGLTSMILDCECFGIFFIRILRVKWYYDVIIGKKSL